MKWSGTYLSACLTQICSLKCDRDALLDDMFLTAATDGHVALWQKPGPHSPDQATLSNSEGASIQWMTRKRVHQNAINTLCCFRLSEMAAVIITGGDDNAVSISILRAKDGLSKEALCSTSIDTLLIPRAHTAAVTALKIIPPSETQAHVVASDNDSGQALILVTASNDQRTKFWSLRVDLTKPGLEGVEVSKLQNEFTPVADVAAMDSTILDSTTTRHGILTCGVGMELWTVEEPA